MPWKAQKEYVSEIEFEEARRCLLNLYHSYVQNHAGYMIAILIGISALISSFDAFFKSGVGRAFWILTVVIILPAASYYMIRRLLYWSFFASEAINFTIDEAIEFFNEWNEKRQMFRKVKAPYTAILHSAIGFKFRRKKENKELSRLHKIFLLP